LGSEGMVEKAILMNQSLSAPFQHFNQRIEAEQQQKKNDVLNSIIFSF